MLVKVISKLGLVGEKGKLRQRLLVVKRQGSISFEGKAGCIKKPELGFRHLWVRSLTISILSPDIFLASISLSFGHSKIIMLSLQTMTIT